MTLRAKNTYWLYKHQINKTTVQSFKKFFILDFEATCDENGSLSPQVSIYLYITTLSHVTLIW